MATRADADDAGTMAQRAALRAVIETALREHGGNRTLAARAAGYKRPGALRRAAKRVGLDLATIAPPSPKSIGAKKKPRTPKSG